MHPSISSRGQSALEYLFLLAGGVIIVIIILLSVIGLTPLGQSFLGTNIQEYEKIDLCTGHTADCSVASDWGVGVQQMPIGVQLTNTTWRDLYIDGFGLDLQCYSPTGYIPCTQDNFYIVPPATDALQLGLILPVQSGTCADVSSNPGTTPPIYDCSPCDPNTSTCMLIPGAIPFVPMCPLAAPAACVVPVIPFTQPGVSSPPNGGFILKAGQSREVGIAIGGDFEGKGNSKEGHLSFRVSQVKPNLSNPGKYDVKPNSTGVVRTKALGYYDSWKYYTGASHVCRNLNLSIATHNFFWCDNGLGAISDVSVCSYDQTYPLFSTPSATYTYLSNPQNDVADFSNFEGEVVRLDVSPLATTAVVPNSGPVIGLEFSNFTNPASPCWSQTNPQAACDAACNAYVSGVTPYLKFYRINPGVQSTNWCDTLASASGPNITPLNATLLAIGSNPGSVLLYSGGSNPVGAGCTLSYAIPSLTGISNPQNFYLGVRTDPNQVFTPGQLASFPKMDVTLRAHLNTISTEKPVGPHVMSFTLTP